MVITNRNGFRVLFDLKLLPYVLFEKIYLYVCYRNGQPREPALCHLYRHTFLPCRSRYRLKTQRTMCHMRVHIVATWRIQWIDLPADSDAACRYRYCVTWNVWLCGIVCWSFSFDNRSVDNAGLCSRRNHLCRWACIVFGVDLLYLLRFCAVYFTVLTFSLRVRYG